MMERENDDLSTALPDQTKKDLGSDKKKGIDSKGAENMDAPNVSPKITQFFPILRMHSRTKMGSSENTMDKSIDPKDSLTITPGAVNKASVTAKPQSAKFKEFLAKMPNKNVNAFLNTALKTSLSEVLRKNIANQSEANRLANLSKEKTLISAKGTENTPKPLIGQSLINQEGSQSSEQKSFAAENYQALLATAKVQSVSGGMPPKTSISKPQNAMKHSGKSTSNGSKHSSPEMILPIEPDVESPLPGIGKEDLCLKEKENAVKNESTEKNNDCLVSEPSTMVTIKQEILTEPVFPAHNETILKPKKNKKRHFKGATYSLYLTPARKKKRYYKKKAIDSNVKDEEMSLPSTENGSYLDSSDACSMFSDDFNTSSEKSLADDEAAANYRCSPIQVAEIKVEASVQNQINNKDGLSAEKSVAQDTTYQAPKNSEQLHVSVTPAENEPASCLPDIVIKQEVDPVDEKDFMLDNANIAHTQESEQEANLDFTVKTAGCIKSNTRKSASSYSATVCEKTIQAVKMPVEPKTETQYTFPTLNNMEGNNISSESSKIVPLSTIATSVKSRQRMKRRFTDDIVDTDVGILSLNSMASTCRKSKADLHPPPQIQDIIQNFEISFNTEARGGPVTKIETVFSSKQPPVDKCFCNGKSYEVKHGGTPKNLFCQAVDSFDEKLVGCCNPVTVFRLVRPSVRIPFSVMCEMHLWRFKYHHCCPRCGVFCSQGTFVQCTAEKHKVHGYGVHLYHERCEGSSVDAKFNFCLHCGSNSHSKVIRLECEMMCPPAFFQSQYTLSLISRAKISCTTNAVVQKKPDDSSCTYQLGEDKILTYDGLPEQFMKTLKIIVTSLDVKNIGDLPDYPITELYSASLNGDVKKVLYMLAKGVNPNEKFPEYNESIALHAAASSGNLLITHILLQAGAVCDTMNRNLRTALMIATENNHEDVVECLVKHEAPLNTKGEVGMTCLHLASRDGHLKLCRLFLDSGRARVNAQDDGGWTPIVWASEHGQLDVVNLLISRGGDPNIRDNEGNTALHWAAFCGTVEVCTLLLDHNCCVNEANEHGDTPLHIAARQNNFRCIDLFLSSSANVGHRNRAGELPIDCCSSNPENMSREAISTNMLLRKIIKFPLLFERVVSQDIANGREQYPIRCINGVDDAEVEDSEFLYVVENCETCPIKIDRCITSLQHCSCKDHCTASSCTCSAISFKCWYDKDGHLLPEFNLLDPPLLFECNRACSCDIGICRNRVVQRGMMCRLELIRTVGRGWGVRTLNDIPKGTFICEYVGELITDSEADTRQDDSYLFDLDNKDGETYCLDARYFGNISRFINHFCEPNLIPVKVFIDHQDLSFPRIAFFSLRHIFQYEELGFDYGEKFWVIKSKSFTCNCESIKCKYSAETIKETLECYNNRVREELHDEMDMYSV